MPKKTLALAIAKQADVVVQVKDNQPTLLDVCKSLGRLRAAVQCDMRHDKAHGRVETRTVQTFDMPSYWLPDGWESMICQFARIDRAVERRTRNGWVRTDETAWWISTTSMSAADFQLAIRGHWSIENQNHHVRDVALCEDACRTRNRPAVLARLRSMALNCLRAARVPNVTVALYRHAMNFERLRQCACGNTKT